MTGIGSIRIVSCMKGTGWLAPKKEMCRLQGPTQLCRIAEFRVVCPNLAPTYTHRFLGVFTCTGGPFFSLTYTHWLCRVLWGVRMCTSRLWLCRVRPVHIAGAVFCGTLDVYRSLVFWSDLYTSQLLCFVGLWTCIGFCRRTVCISKIKAACAEPVSDLYTSVPRIRSRVDPAFGAQASQRRKRAGSGPGAWAWAVGRH